MKTPAEREQNPGVRTFEVVLRWIEQQILDGRLAVGDRLLPERELAAELGVSRAAVREAIRALEAQGVLTSQVGGGAAAGTHVTAQRSEALGRLLRLQVALAQFPVEDVVVARIALERSSAELAAARRSDDDLTDLRDLLGRMCRPGLSIGAFNELDTEFHVLIARAARASLVSDLTRATRVSLAGPIHAAELQMADWEQFRARLIDEHASVVDAILDGDAARAADALEAHIRGSYAILTSHF